MWGILARMVVAQIPQVRRAGSDFPPSAVRAGQLVAAPERSGRDVVVCFWAACRRPACTFPHRSGQSTHHRSSCALTIVVMARVAPLVALGYGKYVRADRVYALVPLEGGDRGDGRRTLVHVEGIEAPLVASRSEVAIARDLAGALGQPEPGGRQHGSKSPGQEVLF